MDQGIERPLVTFVLVAFNQEKYVKHAIESALAETYRPIQFIFSDDCSMDRTFEIMCEVAARYEEKENIFLNRNDQNIGVVDHLNKLIIDFAKGKYIVVLAGDDITSTDRTEKIVACFETTGASAVSVNPIMIDENGQEIGKRFFNHLPNGVLYFEEYFVKGAPFFGGGGYAPELFETYGPMKNSARNEDRILPCRASTLGGIAYLNEPVYFYREHGDNMSFWVKVKRDPENRLGYEVASRENQLQNLINFDQEVQECYQGTNKDRMLKQIRLQANTIRFQIQLLSLGFLSRVVVFIRAILSGCTVKDARNFLAMCISPAGSLSLLNLRQLILEKMKGR